jgi:hypothetical protein
VFGASVRVGGLFVPEMCAHYSLFSPPMGVFSTANMSSPERRGGRLAGLDSGICIQDSAGEMMSQG